MRPGFEPAWETLGLAACYDLELDLSLAPPDYTGTVQVTFANLTGQALPDLVFRLYPNAERIYGGDLQVSSSRVDGMPVEAEVFLPDRTALRLSLANPLSPGEITVVELEFSGVVPVDRAGQTGVYGTFNYDSAGEVLVLANGYPILATYEDGGWRADPVVGIGDAVVSETALYHVQVAAPPGWQVAATGVQAPESTGETPPFEFFSGPVREFILAGSPNFVEEQVQVNGVQVRHWGLPDGEDRWEAALQAAVDSIALFDERFGSYPYRELDVVAVPLWQAAGAEYPGLVLLRQVLYLSGPDNSPGLEYVVAHEVAHQWWYGVVGNDVLEHPWQDEALATYSALLYQEEYQAEAYAGTLRFYRGRVEELEAGESETGVDQPVEAFQNNPGAYSPVVYLKGSLFFDDLRERLGDETFFRALQSYYAQHAYGLPPPQALLDAFEGACRCSLDAVYQEWGVK
jgi:aminopeptidase N